MNQALNQCIADIYQLAHNERLNFREQALKRMQVVLPFDAGVWANGSHAPHRIHASYVFNMSKKLLDIYNSAEIFVKQDFVRSAAVAKPDHPVIATDIHTREEFEQMLTYKLLCRPLGIEQAMGIAHRDERAGLFDYMAIWRRSKTLAFSDDDRNGLQLLWPHLLAADAIWLNNNLVDKSRSLVARHLGMFDRYGVLRVADENMVQRLASDWPDWTGPSLPPALQTLAQAAKQHNSLQSLELAPGTRYSIEPYVCPLTGDAFKLYAEINVALAQLSAAEAKIAAPYALGLTHKEIAKQVGLSPGTVRNHAQTILKKLGLRNKTELSRHVGTTIP